MSYIAEVPWLHCIALHLHIVMANSKLAVASAQCGSYQQGWHTQLTSVLDCINCMRQATACQISYVQWKPLAMQVSSAQCKHSTADMSAMLQRQPAMLSYCTATYCDQFAGLLQKYAALASKMQEIDGCLQEHKGLEGFKTALRAAATSVSSVRTLFSDATSNAGERTCRLYCLPPLVMISCCCSKSDQHLS